MKTNKIRSSASSPSKKPKSLSEPRFGNLGTCVYVDFFLFLLHVLRLFFKKKRINDVLFRNSISDHHSGDREIKVQCFRSQNSFSNQFFT